jgi:hypothetical protein
LVPEILDVDVGAEPHVIRQVPADMIRIVVDHDIVTAPDPIVAGIIIVRGNIEVETTKPETLPVSAFNPVYMATANFAAEVPMFPGMIEVVMRIFRAGVVPDPLIVLSVDVRRFGMPVLVAIAGARIIGLPAAITAIRWSRGSGWPIRGRATSRDVTSANMSGTATTALCTTATAWSASAFLLSYHKH